ncbi:MAG: hypothetical protein KJ804_08040 [Proteobacteria bacterium]|nr:hypothetical protein [Pseudomonadota bacterium]MBU1058250.1 hypothetical protein [Pseudomonadota bacterium]
MAATSRGISFLAMILLKIAQQARSRTRSSGTRGPINSSSNKGQTTFLPWPTT